MRIGMIVERLGLLIVGMAFVPTLGLSLQTESSRPAGNSPVVQVFTQRCLGCHSGAAPEGDVDLTRPSQVVHAENATSPLDGRLWQVIANGEMPADGDLTSSEKEIIRAWLVDGAAGDFEPIDPLRYSSPTRAGYDWWAWQPLPAIAPPPVAASDRVRNCVDQFVLARLENEGFGYGPDAEPRQQVRRLYFDLTGLPPPPEVVEAFSTDPSDAAYSALVDRLLSSPEYGERWGRHWLDIVRYGESDGFERNGPRRDSWRYRDWVIDALNADLSYDEFARRQIAGDVLCDDPVEGAAASGFLVAGVHNTVVGASRSMQLLARQDELEDLIGAVGQTFWGLTINCARCHDHKFDPLMQREYYQLVAAVADVQPGTRQIRAAAEQRELESLAARLADIRIDLNNLERPIRDQILAERQNAAAKAESAPGSVSHSLGSADASLVAAWDFQEGLVDRIGGQTLELAGDSHIAAGGLTLDGEGDFAMGSTLTSALKEKTLAVWVVLDDLEQRGGGTLSIETPDGGVFDAIVFGEQEPQRWMAGSNGFVRTQSFGGEGEPTPGEPLFIAITYDAQGWIRAYRNGLPYGQAYQSSGPVEFLAGNGRVLLGLRHSPPGGNRFFRGTIQRAQLYDRALTAEEIGQVAVPKSLFVSRDELRRRLADDQAAQHDQWLEEMERLESRRAELNAHLPASIYTAVSTPSEPTRLLPRGDVMHPGEQVEPALPNFLLHAKIPWAESLGADFGQARPRAQLAQALTAAENPLFPRVIVNRLWHYHFGRGLVATPSDLGFNGGVPSHPELLDWLAGELRRNGMRLKPLHRLLVNSTAYRQSSRFDAAAHARDAENRWLWRRSPARLDAETVRDAMLWVSGRLNPQRGGPGFDDVAVIDNNNGTTYYEPIDREDPQLNRRTIYRFTPRGGRSALLDSLDCPDPSTATPRRSVTTTPLQALSLQNNDLVLRLAAAFGEGAAVACPGDTARQVDWMFRRAYGRGATPAELSAADRVAQKHGLAAVARALFNSNEFILVQ